jgi:flagellar hook-basal body complex protein FliE
MDGIRGIDLSKVSQAPERPQSASTEPAGSGSFSEALGQALGATEKLQLSADAESEKLALGGGNLHEVTLALEKADIAMRVAVRVRNKLIDAYQEIMRMNV